MTLRIWILSESEPYSDIPVVVEGRNLLGTEVRRYHGFIYLSVGRPDIVPNDEELLSYAVCGEGRAH